MLGMNSPCYDSSGWCYQVLFRQMLSDAYGMFKSIEESRVLWFDGDSFSPHNEFELVGTCIGIAIYNAIILDLHFPVSHDWSKRFKGRVPLDRLALM